MQIDKNEAISAIHKRPWLFVAGVGLLVVTIAWYWTLPRPLFMGDDLIILHAAHTGGYASNPLLSLIQTHDGKYRPLINFVYSVMVPIFGNHIMLYVLANLAVQSANALLVYLLAKKLSRGNDVIAMMAAWAFAISRFAYFNIIQLVGIEEGLALFFMLLVVLQIVTSFERQEPRRMLFACVWFAAAILTHERFLFLFPFMAAATFLHPALNMRKRIAFFAVASGIVSVDFCIKAFALHTNFFVGTGGQSLAFHPAMIAGFFVDGLLNTIGFNLGPDYLSAVNTTESGALGWALALASALCVMFSIGLYFVKARSWIRERNLLLFLALYLPLVLSACITIRQEFRWLYAPFVVLLLALAAVVGNATDEDVMATRTLAQMSVAACMVLSFCSAIYYRQFIGNIYLEQAFNIARSTVAKIQHTGAKNVVLVDHGGPAKWIFDGRAFFDEYNLSGVSVRYVHDASADVIASGALVLDVANSDVSVVESNNRGRWRAGKLEYSFVDHFLRGAINSRRHVDTPTGLGAMVLPWKSPDGKTRSLTIVAPFRYSYELPTLQPNSALSFEVSKPFSSGADVLAWIDVRQGAKTTRVFEKVVRNNAGAEPEWRHATVSLARFAGKPVLITFGADGIAGNLESAWVAYAEPVILRVAHGAAIPERG